MSGVLVRPHFDAGGDRFAIEHAQDCTDIVARNRRLQGEAQRGDFRHVASIPNVIIVKWLDEEWRRGNAVMPFTPAFDEVVTRKLRDPDWAFLRTDCQANQFRRGYGG
jgi:hypothetical protein